MALSSQGMSALEAQLKAHFLVPLGGFAPLPSDGMPTWARTLVLLGPAGGEGFWCHLQSQPEWGGPDPVDRWSRRIIDALAKALGGAAFYPFGGPPYHPFVAWAGRTQGIWQSPIGLLVHKTQGLMVSFRGALALPQEIALSAHERSAYEGARPCDACPKPCVSACPAHALGADQSYDSAACHAFLDRPEGSGTCLEAGCLARRACPLSQIHPRAQAQSAYHMRRFHPPPPPPAKSQGSPR